MRVRTRVFCGHGELVQVRQLVSLRRWMASAQRTVTKAFQSVNARNTHQRDEYFQKKDNKRTTNSTRTQERASSAAVQTAAGALHS